MTEYLRDGVYVNGRKVDGRPRANASASHAGQCSGARTGRASHAAALVSDERNGIIRRFGAVLVAALTLTPAAHTAITKKPPWMSRFAWAVGICETGKGNRYPDFQHRTQSYGGFTGWYWGTWQLDAPKGYPAFPWLATPKQQYRVFLIGRAKGRYWGCIENGGYRAWM